MKKKYLGYCLPITSGNNKWYRNIVTNKPVIALYFTSSWGAMKLIDGGRVYLAQGKKIYYRGTFVSNHYIGVEQAYNTYKKLNQLTSLGIDTNGSLIDLINLVKNTLKNDLDIVNENTEIGLIEIELDTTGPCSNVNFKEHLNQKGVYTDNIY